MPQLMRRPLGRLAFFYTVSASLLIYAPLARADDSTQLDALENQVKRLQNEIHQIKNDMAKHQQMMQAIAAQAQQKAHAPTMPNIPPGYALVPAAPGSTAGTVLEQIQAAPPPEPPLPMGTFRVGDVTVRLGGFIETAGIFRTHNEVADMASNFNTGIPTNNSPNAHQSETRLSARQSRVSALVQAQPDSSTLLSAYGEFDFLGAAPTANSVESNSYTPRVRHLYAVYDRTDLGLSVLAGQTWSLLTMDKQGIGYLQSNMNIPLTIDAQYVAGFTWARQPQIRVADTFANGLFSVAASIENPQTAYYTGPNGLAPASVGTIDVANAGGSGFASTVNYSNDSAPDIIGKIAFDPGFAHFEAYGLLRFLRDRVSMPGSGTNETATAGGGGGAVLVHVLPQFLDLQGSILAGSGIGRYGSAQLPDATVGPNGQPVALPEVEGMVGLVAHPLPQIDIYGYAGTEQVSARSYSAEVKNKLLGYGYGSPLYVNTDCDIELGASAGCVANTEGVTDGTVGGWYRLLHNDYGTVQVGASYAYLRRSVFGGIGHTPEPDENIMMLSFRYYPFQ